MKRVLVIPDLQLPYEDKKSLNAVEQYMGDHEWDEVIQIGDFMDFDIISSHNKENLRAISGKTIDKDYEYGNAVLDRWQKLAPKAKFTIIEGNHEFRMERYIDANPVLEGKMEVPGGLNLNRRGIKWIPYWSKGDVYRVGKASFIHGTYVNQYHAKKHLEAYDTSVFYGHVHSVQSFSKVQKKGKPMIAQSLGCLCELNQGYMRGRPSNWVHAFAVFYIQDNGNFNHFVVQVVDHKFVSPEGKLYIGK